MSYISCRVKIINELVLEYDHVHHQNHNTITTMHALILHILHIYIYMTCTWDLPMYWLLVGSISFLIKNVYNSKSFESNSNVWRKGEKVTSWMGNMLDELMNVA
jgi:hypothetical protein